MSLIYLSDRVDETGIEDNEGQRSETRTHWGRSNNPQDSSFTIRRDPMLPRVYSRHPDDPGMYLLSKNATRKPGTADLWDIDLNYATLEEEEKDPNPLQRPAEIDWKTVIQRVPAIVDINGEPIINAAGDPIVAEKEEIGLIATIEKNIPPGPAGNVLKFVNVINSDNYKIDGIDVENETSIVRTMTVSRKRIENDIRHRVAKLELHIRKQGWGLNLHNKGLHEIVEEIQEDPETGEAILVSRKVRILDDKGEPVSEPQYLDEKGKRPTEVGEDGVVRPKKKLDKSDIITLKFSVRQSLKFKNRLPMV